MQLLAIWNCMRMRPKIGLSKILPFARSRAGDRGPFFPIVNFDDVIASHVNRSRAR